MLTLKELLVLRGLDINHKIKIVRHKDTREDVNVYDLFLKDIKEFELYQSHQERNQFANCEYIVSCIGISNKQALFIGVYEVKSMQIINGFPKDKSVSFRGKAKTNSKYYYDLEKKTGFEDFEGKVVINWNEVGQAWCVGLDTSIKEVVQILPKAFVREFPGYNEVKLFHNELKRMTEDPISNMIWHKLLSSVNAIYLIVDTTDGKQYVGSSYGKEGLLGRWKTYAQNGHGNNIELLNILKNDPKRINNFRYSILQTFPTNVTKVQILKEEMNYIDKLGTRAFGLNY